MSGNPVELSEAPAHQSGFYLAGYISKEGPLVMPEETEDNQAAVVVPEEEPQPTATSHIIGSINHDALWMLGQDPTGEELMSWMIERYGEKPYRYLGWSAMMQYKYADIERMQRPGIGREVTRMREMRLYMGEGAIESFRELAPIVLDEKKKTGGDDGPVALALRVYKGYLKPGEQDGLFDGRVEALTDLPISKDAFLSHTHKTRAMYLAHEGDMAMSPNTRPDVVDLDYDEKDTEAKCIAESFAAVLATGIGHDPDKLAEIRVPYDGRGVEESMSAIQAVHQAAVAIESGRIKMTIRDYKFLTHLGKNDSRLDPVWREFGGDLNAIFDEQTLQRHGAAYSKLREFWLETQYDLFKSTLGMWNLFRIAENEYCKVHQDAAPADIDNLLMNLIENEAVFIDFDARSKKGYVVDGSEGKIEYKVEPKLELTAVPNKVTAAIKQAAKGLRAGFKTRWENEIYAEVSRVKKRLGTLAARKEDAKANMVPKKKKSRQMPIRWY